MAKKEFLTYWYFIYTMTMNGITRNRIFLFTQSRRNSYIKLEVQAK